MKTYKINMVNSDVLTVKTDGFKLYLFLTLGFLISLLGYDEFLKKIFNGDRFIQVIQDVLNGTLEVAICPAHIAYIEQANKR